MKDRLLEIAAQLAQPETAARREAVLHFLSRAGISHEVRTGHAKPDPGGFSLFTQSVPKTEVEVQNIIVRPLNNDGPKLVIGAHYDAFPGSPGANDNASGMAVLLALAQELSRSGCDKAVELVFFDAEESGRAGSIAYLAECASDQVAGMVNLDVCGYGDTLCVRCMKKTPLLRNFTDKARLRRFDGEEVCYLPDSDDKTFTKGHIPALSVAMLPRWDSAILPALKDYANGFLGIPPELREQVASMEIMSTLHGGPRDNPGYLSEAAMRRVLDFMLDALNAPLSKRTLWQTLTGK